VKHDLSQIQPADRESPWQKTLYANLIRYAPSGKYFAQIRVGGKLIRQSLKTTTARGSTARSVTNPRGL
jgi:hypothetical protein